MLTVFRKYKKGLFSAFIAGFLALMMLNFGLGAYFSRKDTSPAIKVNEHEISFQDYSAKLEQVRQLYRKQYGKNFSQIEPFLNLTQQVIDGLINERLLQDFSASQKLTASTRQMQDYIAENLLSGNVTKESYLAAVRRLGLTPEGFEYLLRQQLAQSQLQSFFTDLSRPSTPELRNAFNESEKKARFLYAEFAPKDFEAKVENPTDNELSEFYASHEENYREPRKVRYTYAAFRPEQFVRQVEVLPEDIQAYYQDHRVDFQTPAEVQIRSLGIPIAQSSALQEMVTGEKSNPSANAKQKALDAFQALQSGVSFEEAITKFGNPEFSSAQSTWKTFADLKAEEREKLANVGVGGFSAVVELKDRYEILFVDGQKPTEILPLDKVKQDVEQKLRTQQAPIYADAAARNFLQQVKNQNDVSQQTFKDLAAKASVAVDSPETFWEKENDPAGLRGLSEQLMGYDKGEVALVNIDNVTIVAYVEDIRESAIPALDQVREKVTRAYRDDRASALAKSAATDFLTKLKDSNLSKDMSKVESTFKTLATTTTAAIHETKLATSHDQFDDALRNLHIREVAFQSTTHQPVVSEVLDDGKRFFVFATVEIQNPTDAEFAAKQHEMLAQERNRSGQRLWDSLIALLRQRSEIWVNPTLFEAGARKV